MSYIDKNLMSGESVIYRARKHWVVFRWSVIFFVLWLSITGRGEPSIAVLWLILAIVTGISSLIDYITSEFGITNKRLIIKEGFIRRRSLELLLTKVESIQVDQGIFGRMLGYGTITISGTGSTREHFRKISSPFKFRKKAQEQIASIQEAKS